MTGNKENPLFQGESNPHCPDCNSALEIKSSKKGPFWACSAYPRCHYTKPLTNHSDVQIVKILDDVCCPVCESDLAVKSGKYGMFIGCTNYPICDFMVKQDDDNDYEALECPLCKQGELHMRSNKKGHRFYACNKYPECDYLLNHLPVKKHCGNCHWPLMERIHEDHLQCPNCQHKVDHKND